MEKMIDGDFKEKEETLYIDHFYRKDTIYSILKRTESQEIFGNF